MGKKKDKKGSKGMGDMAPYSLTVMDVLKKCNCVVRGCAYNPRRYYGDRATLFCCNFWGNYGSLSELVIEKRVQDSMGTYHEIREKGLSLLERIQGIPVEGLSREFYHASGILSMPVKYVTLCTTKDRCEAVVVVDGVTAVPRTSRK